MDGKWIQGADLKEGSFTKKAKKAGKTVPEYAAEKADAPGKLGKQARLAQTFEKMGHDKAEKPKKERSNLEKMAGRAATPRDRQKERRG